MADQVILMVAGLFVLKNDHSIQYVMKIIWEQVYSRTRRRTQAGHPRASPGPKRSGTGPRSPGVRDERALMGSAAVLASLGLQPIEADVIAPGR